MKKKFFWILLAVGVLGIGGIIIAQSIEHTTIVNKGYRGYSFNKNSGLSGTLTSTGASQNKSSDYVYEHNICKTISGTTSDTIFIPTQTSSEWTTFRTHLPSNISLGVCGCYTHDDCNEGWYCYGAVASRPPYCKGIYTYTGSTNVCNGLSFSNTELKCYKGGTEHLCLNADDIGIYFNGTFYSANTICPPIGITAPVPPITYPLNPDNYTGCIYPCRSMNQVQCSEPTVSGKCLWCPETTTIDCNSPIDTTTKSCRGLPVPASDIKCYSCGDYWVQENGQRKCHTGGYEWMVSHGIADCESRGGKMGFQAPSPFPLSFYEISRNCMFSGGIIFAGDWNDDMDDEKNWTCYYPCASFTSNQCNRSSLSGYCNWTTSTSTGLPVTPDECSRRNCERITETYPIPGTCVEPPAVCGPVHGGTYGSLELNDRDLCSVGGRTGFATTSTGRKWNCVNGSSTVSCSAYKTAQCGLAKGGIYGSLYSTNSDLCSVGSSTSFSTASAGRTWNCINGSSIVSCNAYKNKCSGNKIYSEGDICEGWGVGLVMECSPYEAQPGGACCCSDCNTSCPSGYLLGMCSEISSSNKFTCETNNDICCFTGGILGDIGR